MQRSQLLRAIGALGAVMAGAIPSRLAAGPPRHITLHVVSGATGKLGPDHQRHDAFEPASFTIPANVPVTITVINQDPEAHSITSSGIPIDQEIAAAKKGKDGKIIAVTTTFTMKVRPGKYRWFCKEPCDRESTMWSMGSGATGRGEEGFMAGYITAV